MTAISISVGQERVKLGFWKRSDRVLKAHTVTVDTAKRNVIVFDGELLDGTSKRSYLYSYGFSKEEWIQISSQLTALGEQGTKA